MGEEYIERMESLETLNRRGSFLKESFFPTQLKPRFPKNKLLIGFNKMEKKEIWLPVNEGFRLIQFGITRGGKTFLSERMITTSFRGGNGVAILFDSKNEFHTLAKPLQKKFHDSLAPEEEPMGLPMKVYRPQFLIKNDRGKDYGNLPMQISLTDCEFSDLVTLMGLEKDESKRGMLSYLFDAVREGVVQGIADVPKFIHELTDFAASQKKAFLVKFQPLVTNQVLGEDYPFDFSNDVILGHIPVMNLEGFEVFGREFSSYPQSFVAICLRQLIRAKRNGDIDKKLYIFIDELPRICPRNGEPSSKKEILEAVDLVAGKGINFLFSAQDSSGIPPEILRQCRFVMLPYNAGRSLIEDVMREKGLLRWSPTSMNYLLDGFKSMKRFEWVLIDSFSTKEMSEETAFESLQVFKSYPPLGFHQETSGKN